MRKLVLIAIVAVAALSLVGCSLTAHGGGVVDLVGVNDQWYEPGTASATFALTTMCNDHKDALMTTLVWNDRTNGVQFTARLPWTPISQLSTGEFTTCEQLAAYADSYLGDFKGTVTAAYLDARGQQVGQVMVEVTPPGQPLVAWNYIDFCGGTASNVLIEKSSTDGGLDYMAVGCLDKGKLVFQ